MAKLILFALLAVPDEEGPFLFLLLVAKSLSLSPDRKTDLSPEMISQYCRGTREQCLCQMVCRQLRESRCRVHIPRGQRKGALL